MDTVRAVAAQRESGCESRRKNHCVAGLDFDYSLQSIRGKASPRLMKKLTLTATLFILIGSIFYACGAEVAIAPETPKSAFSSLSVSPYYTLGLHDFDGNAKSGVGLEAALPLSKSVSFVTFGEADNNDGSTFDRAGAGLQFTGKLGKLRPFGRMSAGYAFEGSGSLDESSFFLRPQFGADLPFYRSGGFEAGLTASWALDVDLNGNATQRLFGGVGLKWAF